jgi:colicin import membrane protein
MSGAAIARTHAHARHAIPKTRRARLGGAVGAFLVLLALLLSGCDIADARADAARIQAEERRAYADAERARAEADAARARAEAERARGDRDIAAAVAGQVRGVTAGMKAQSAAIVAAAVAALLFGVAACLLGAAALQRAATERALAVQLLPRQLPTEARAAQPVRAIETGRAFPALIRADLVERDAYGREIRRV